MSAPARRRLLVRALAAGAALAGTGTLLGVRAALGDDAPAPREIAITAQRFHYTPNDIALKTGEPVVLVITALDFPHGFNIPDLFVRADLVPGKAVRVAITPPRSGIVPFLCDNFCGDGHETMQGRFVVSD